MILFLVGLVCFLAAVRVARAGPRGAGDDVRRAGAAAWAAVVALLTLTQLWVGREALDGYRLTLLGFRYQVADLEGTPLDRALAVSGSYDEADLWVPGAGERPVARLGYGAGAEGLVLTATAADDAGSVALVEERGLLGSTWRVLGGVPLEPGDHVQIQVGGGSVDLVVEERTGRADVLGVGVPLPWLSRHVLAPARPAPAGGEGPAPAALTTAVELPPVETSLTRQVRDFKPSPFQRTYPLADVVEQLEPGAFSALPSLTSFLYYQDGALHLADLDSEVVVPGREGPGTLPVWSPARGGRRILVAGLPHRDYPEPDLTLPERYGIRPLRSFRLSVSDGWLDATLGSPEIRALDREALETLRLPDSRAPDGSLLYRIRLTPGRNALARQSVVFDAAPAAFAVAGQAVLRLPEDPTAGSVGILTPSGLARWETGRPIGLGAGDRRLLMRVDGSGTSTGFWLTYLVLFGLVVALFARRPMPGPVFALALTAMGLVCLRLVLGLSAAQRYPFVQEAQQIALWLLPLLPWAVALAGEAGRTDRDPDLLSPTAWRRWVFHLGYGLAMLALAVVLFEGSRAKQAVLGVVPLGLLAAWGAARAGWRPWEDAADRLRGLMERRDRWLGGWGLGALLLGARVVLEAIGWREQLTVGGTRIGVSVFYTPAALSLFALLLLRWGERIVRARGGEATARAASGALWDLGGFLLLAYVGVSGWISDFGIALVLLPGALVVLAVLGHRWAPGGRPGRMAAGALALPLVLFVLVQAAPPLLRFAWGGDLQASDARLGEWNRNELLLLERGDPGALQLIGQRRSEALAVMRETMRSYTRGNVLGKGFLQGRVSDEVAETSTREHTVSALLASQFGWGGTAGLALLLLALVAPVLELLPRGESARRGVRTWLPLVAGLAGAVALAYLLPSPFNTLVVGLMALAALGAFLGPRFWKGAGLWTGLWGGGRGPHEGEAGEDRAQEQARAAAREAARAAAAAHDDPADALPSLALLWALAVLFTVSFAGLYMLLANYGFVFFTGKNVYLLGLDSVGDVLEALVLLAGAAVALGSGAGALGPGTELEPVEPIWWHPSDREEESGS